MAVNITFLNHDGSGLGVREQVSYGTTVERLFRNKWPLGNPAHFSITVNSEIAVPDQVLREGDRVSMIAVDEEALEEGYGQRANANVAQAHGPLAGSDQVRVLFIANDGAGFAQNIFVNRGTTVGQLVNQRCPSLSGRVITLNGTPGPLADHVLVAGDKVSVVPIKVAAAAGIRVLFLSNDGTGFAVNKEEAENTTLAEFLGRNLSGNSGDYHIKVNSQHQEAGYTLQNGDKIVATPKKVEGA